MTTSFGSRLASSLFVGSLIWACNGVPAAAQVSSNDILNTLSPLTRSLTVSPAPQAAVSDPDAAFIQSLRNRTRSLTIDEGEHVVALSKDRPKIDLEIYFDYNSAVITAKARPQLDALGEALHSPRLEGAVIVLGGHTDAKGGDEFNLKLSQRRAEAVKRYLVDKLKLTAENLSTVGYGKRELKNKEEPFSGENRRVQVINLGSSQASR